MHESQVSVLAKGVGLGGLKVPEVQYGDHTLSVKNGYLRPCAKPQGCCSAGRCGGMNCCWLRGAGEAGHLVQLFQGSALMSTSSSLGLVPLPSPRA